MTRAAQTHLIPLTEMTPGMVASIRNSVISQLVAIASKELAIPERDLIVRDIEPYTDLGWNWSTATTGTSEGWEHDMTGATTPSYRTATGASTMGDQRYVAIFGVRDARYIGATADATSQQSDYLPEAAVSGIKFDVGGGTRAIWDISGMDAYDDKVAFSPSAVIISQNSAFEIWLYQRQDAGINTALEIPAFIQLVGVTVEPRGKVISP